MTTELSSTASVMSPIYSMLYTITVVPLCKQGLLITSSASMGIN